MDRIILGRWIFVLAIGLFCLTSVPAGATAAVTICNEGDVTIKTAAVEASNPFFSGTTYYVRGWFDVEAGTCSHVLNTGYSTSLYLGFAYQDGRNVLRTHLSSPSGRDTQFAPTSHRLCVTTSESFEYETRAMDAPCPAGTPPLEFSLYVDLNKLGPIGVTYHVKPYRNEGGAPLSSAGPAEVAQLLLGGEARRTGGVWRAPNGASMASYISDKYPVPPLAPRVQFSPAQQPLAGYVQQIERVLSGLSACRRSTSATYKQQGLSVTERGVARSVILSGGTTIEYEAMVLGDMDFASPDIRQYNGGKEFDGECWTLELHCKASSTYDYCAEHQYAGQGGTRSSAFDIYTNTRDQAVRILDALKRMAPFYPDAKPEIRRIQ